MKESARTGFAAVVRVESACTGSACSDLACTKAAYTDVGSESVCMGFVAGAAPLEPAAFGLLLVAFWLLYWGPFYDSGGGGGIVFCSGGCWCTFWWRGSRLLVLCLCDGMVNVICPLTLIRYMRGLVCEVD
jgi:hypothetical protein